jgi:RNA polymerase sigma-70 factor, ECF subfamily
LKYSDKLNTFIYRKYDREQNEDIIQETFIKIYKSLIKMTKENILSMNLKAWIYKIANNTALNYKRDKQLWTVSIDLCETDETLDEQHPLPEAEIEQKEFNEELYECINQLPEPFRLVIFLHYICELDYQEISHVLGKPLNTIKSIGLRGVNKLRQMIKEER